MAIVARAVTPVVIALSMLLVVLPLSLVVGTTCKSIGSLSFALVQFPLAVVDITIIIIHDAVPLLVVTEPKSVVLVVVGKVIDAVPVLLVLKPLPFVLLTVKERIDAIALTATFLVIALIPVTVLIGCLSFTLWLATHHFALIFTAILSDGRTKRYLLRIPPKGNSRQHQCYNILLQNYISI